MDRYERGAWRLERSPSVLGCRGGEMTLEVIDLSNTCQCSRKDGSVHQLSSIMMPICWNERCWELASFSHVLGPTKPRDRHPVADWSRCRATLHGSDLSFVSNLLSELGYHSNFLTQTPQWKKKSNNSTYLRDVRIKWNNPCRWLGTC